MRTLALWSLIAACGPPDLPPGDGPTPTFAEDVEPILREHCLRCHLDPSLTNEGLGYVLQPRSAGDTTIDPDIARATAVRSACVSVSPTVIEAYADSLYAVAFDATCGGENPTTGSPVWSPLSMPPGADIKLTVDDQVTLVRWIEGGMP
jgi:hypothetical protein